MSSAEFGWESLLHTNAPSTCSLKAALFTTYDRADERFLVEHLLALLLKLNREPEGEGKERQYFLLELDRRLKQLHDRLVVVSSTAREEPTEGGKDESGAYGWIWRSIRNLTVGSRRKAVQHAKLWLLHWGAANDEGDEYVEIVVSSANLTRAAFTGQIQSAWRTCLKLNPRGSKDRLASWGVLPDFLRELFASAGDDERLTPFVDLLSRADCPAGVTFVASVPGTHSRQTLRSTPWGSAGLRKMTPPGKGMVSAAVLSPFVGSWDNDAIDRWCAMFDGSTNRLKLIWIDKNHPWVPQWKLLAATMQALTGAGASLLQLRHEVGDDEYTDPFHEEHRTADNRWSHAKVYLLRRGTSRRLLVTSANFSPSAWGSDGPDGELTIENFELGVCVAQVAWPFDSLEAFDNEEDAATVSTLTISATTGLITWAQAVWDGKNVVVKCRCAGNRDVLGEINRGGESISITNWAMDADGRLRSAQISWSDTKEPPSFVQLTCELETMSVPFFDNRRQPEREDSLPPEVDEDFAQTMRDELLFEQYGGRVAADVEENETTNNDEGGESINDGSELNTIPNGSAGTNDGVIKQDSEDDDIDGVFRRTDSYAVPAFELARQYLRVVDNWAVEVKRAATRGTATFERRVLKRDGQMLMEALQRQVKRDDKKGAEWAIGASLAAEELSLRLKHFPEE